MNYILIVFVKNPIQGKVKTRMAATIGNERAVEVYLELLNHTKSVITKWLEELDVKVQKQAVIYYGDYINDEDLWIKPYFLKKLQVSHPNLGMRMQAAFEQELMSEADRVVIIGSDCLALRLAHLTAAFEALDKNDVVIGPADDGGYYLLGMKRLHRFLFENKSWSQPTLLAETLADIKQTESSENTWLSYHLLETLSDIDTWEDYLRALKAASVF
jgi:rSAM/selenodomain-associated transferase 1